MRRMKKALFWGAAWGLAEASLGHLLHALRVPGLAGFVMIPLAVVLMSRAVEDARDPGAAVAASAVAAAFKFLDLFIPAADILAVVRPAAAILTEGFVLAAAVAVFAALPGRFSPRDI